MPRRGAVPVRLAQKRIASPGIVTPRTIDCSALHCRQRMPRERELRKTGLSPSGRLRPHSTHASSGPSRPSAVSASVSKRASVSPHRSRPRRRGRPTFRVRRRRAPFRALPRPRAAKKLDDVGRTHVAVQPRAQPAESLEHRGFRHDREPGALGRNEDHLVQHGEVQRPLKRVLESMRPLRDSVHDALLPGEERDDLARLREVHATDRYRDAFDFHGCAPLGARTVAREARSSRAACRQLDIGGFTAESSPNRAPQGAVNLALRRRKRA
jgi:hypothetical protein